MVVSGTTSDNALMVAWTVIFASSLAAAWRGWPLAREQGDDTRSAVVLAASAAAPGAALALGIVGIALTHEVTGHSLSVRPWFVVPAVMWILVGPVLLAMSFGIAPPKSLPGTLEAARLGWVIDWALMSGLLLVGWVEAS
jgi:hypothetical protein